MAEVDDSLRGRRRRRWWWRWFTVGAQDGLCVLALRVDICVRGLWTAGSEESRGAVVLFKKGKKGRKGPGNMYLRQNVQNGEMRRRHVNYNILF